MLEESNGRPGGWRSPAWLLLLAAASVAFARCFACAAPFAAFAAIAAFTLPRRDSYALVGSVWLANQAVGFSCLGYPWTLDCLTWGLAIGITATFSTLSARLAVSGLGRSRGPLRLAGAFLAAFAAYEAALILFSLWLGGIEHYTLPIQGRIFVINAAALGGLFALDRLGVAAGLAPSPRPASTFSTRHA